MPKPGNYRGPLEFKVPVGYIDCTSSSDTERIGIPSPDHFYYRMRDKIVVTIDQYNSDQESWKDRVDSGKLADAILEALENI